MNRYEETALRNRLNEQEKLEVLETFARVRDVSKVAVKLDLPIKLVRKTLNDPKFLSYSKALVAHTVGAEFYGEALDIALEIAKDDETKAPDRLRAMAFIEKLLESTTAPKAAQEQEQRRAEAEEEKASLSSVLAELDG
jgi:hypothetical protein